MLSPCVSHSDYQAFVLDKLSALPPWVLFTDQVVISKLFILNLDNLIPIIKPLYSSTGRPAKNQLEIFRAFVAMTALHLSLDEWIGRLKNDRVLQIICGFSGKLPGVASYYDFINRIVPLDERPRFKKKKRKPRKKYKKGEKMPPKNPGVVARLVDRILQGRRFDNRPEKVLQEIFAKISVAQSIELGLINTTLSVSGDGTCVYTGASNYGVKKCKCKAEGNYKCDCPRVFSDPNATWGWDSHNKFYFWGYTGYFINTYNKSLHIDLPLYLRFVQANRHDSVSAVVSLAEFRDLYPNLTVDTFISDSASDNAATYKLLREWNIKAVIALAERGNFKYPPHIKVTDDGVPVCIAGHNMVYWGKCPDRNRLKYRCPLKLGKVSECDCIGDCSPSEYGRTTYIYPDWDLRLFTAIPRGSDEWKAKMKERTACERINDRILNDYGVNRRAMRGKKRISFMATFAAINIHLDAQLAKMKADNSFDFASAFGISAAA